MSDLSNGERVLRFGQYELDRQACELRRAGERIPLQIQPLRVLETLVLNAGEVVTRSQLRAKIWPATVFVDFDHGLNNAINRLRHALQDSADAPTFIETLPRVGYRFVHPVAALKRTGASPAPPLGRARAVRVPAAALALGIALALAVVLLDGVDFRSGRSAAAGVGTVNAEARDAFLRGTKLLEQKSKESIELGIQHLEHATRSDPTFAAAHAALAIAYSVAGGNSLGRFTNPEAVRAPATAAAERALELEPNLSTAHLALARVLDALEPWSPATDVAVEQAYRRALELDAADANVPLYFGNFLATRGRTDEAVAMHRRAYALDPLSPSIASRLGMELVGLGSLDEGLEYLRKTVELDPWQFNSRVRLAWAHAVRGDLTNAQMEFERAERISPRSVVSLSGLAFVAARRGDRERANALLADIAPLAEAVGDPFSIAIVYVGLEDRANALEWLARTARESRSLHLLAPWGINAPIYDWLRDDERFAQIERQVTAAARSGQPVAQAL